MDTIRCPMCGGELKECSHVLAFLAAEVSRLEHIIDDRDAEIMSLELEQYKKAYHTLEEIERLKAEVEQLGLYGAKMFAEVEQLKDALGDMMQLISEHGGKTIQAHATRIGKAFKALEGIK